MVMSKTQKQEEETVTQTTVALDTAAVDADARAGSMVMMMINTIAMYARSRTAWASWAADRVVV